MLLDPCHRELAGLDPAMGIWLFGAKPRRLVGTRFALHQVKKFAYRAQTGKRCV